MTQVGRRPVSGPSKARGGSLDAIEGFPETDRSPKFSQSRNWKSVSWRGRMRGRKPKPTWLKIMTGNPGKRPLNDAEPQPEGLLGEPPEWLTDAQKAAWRDAIE